MLQTIIIGIDGRPQDAEALALARRLGSDDAELIVASVATDGSSDRRDDRFVGGERTAERVVDRAVDDDPRTERAVVNADSVGQGLAQLARGARADLIVVASSRRGLLGRAFAGDTVSDVLRHAPCPVAVAPVGFDAPAGSLTQIVIGYDGSAEADAAAELAAGLAARDDARVGAIQVVEDYAAATALGGISAGVDGRLIDAAYEAACTSLDGLADRFAFEGVITTGRAAHELAEASRDADVLCIGLHEHGILDRLLAGSTAHALLREQSAPLVIVPPRAASSSEPHVSDALDSTP